MVPENKYVLTFQATGCPNKYPLMDWWKTQTDTSVFTDMLALCTLTRSGVASVRQKQQCCGSKDCKPTACTKQRQWAVGIK